jgi:luciferase family oxidoreductase group 1
MAPLRLGVLDQSPVSDGQSPGDALRETIELARLADRLGYSRYWLAEHHNHPGLAGPSPEILIAEVANATERIRVGSGGVMLPHYAPLKVAENFRVLEALHPGRIDLGLGRAPGSDQITAMALNRGEQPDEFPNQVQDLIGWLENRLNPRHPFARVHATPDPGSVPELWLLGSSDFSASVAAVLGTAFSFAHFINPRTGPDAVALYRREFRSDGRLDDPQVSIGVAAIAADTEAEAERLAKSLWLWRHALEQGRPIPFPDPDVAARHPFTDAERARWEKNRANVAIGAPEQVRDRLTEIAGRYNADEVIVLTICHDPAARRRSYELVAEACGITAAATA